MKSYSSRPTLAEIFHSFCHNPDQHFTLAARDGHLGLLAAHGGFAAGGRNGNYKHYQQQASASKQISLFGNMIAKMKSREKYGANRGENEGSSWGYFRTANRKVNQAGSKSPLQARTSNIQGKRQEGPKNERICEKVQVPLTKAPEKPSKYGCNSYKIINKCYKGIGKLQGNGGQEGAVSKLPSQRVESFSGQNQQFKQIRSQGVPKPKVAVEFVEMSFQNFNLGGVLQIQSQIKKSEAHKNKEEPRIEVVVDKTETNLKNNHIQSEQRHEAFQMIQSIQQKKPANAEEGNKPQQQNSIKNPYAKQQEPKPNNKLTDEQVCKIISGCKQNMDRNQRPSKSLTQEQRELLKICDINLNQLIKLQDSQEQKTVPVPQIKVECKVEKSSEKQSPQTTRQNEVKQNKQEVHYVLRLISSSIAQEKTPEAQEQPILLRANLQSSFVPFSNGQEIQTSRTYLFVPSNIYTTKPAESQILQPRRLSQQSEQQSSLVLQLSDTGKDF